MIEILFHGKRKDNGEWVEGDLIQLHDGRRFIVDNLFGACIDDKGNFVNTESPFVCEVIPETVGQYTGLIDKNGKKIFEGNVVRRQLYGRFDVTYTVEYNVERRGYYPFARGDGCGCCENETESPEETEIIGNIHDNPELFGGRQWQD